MEKIETDVETSDLNQEFEEDVADVESVPNHTVQLNENGELIISVQPVYDDNGFLVIDGSQGEGGGQMVRMALAFSCIFGKPVHLVSIRANRNNPGLGKQHLAIVQLLKAMYNATASTFEEGTTELIFVPGLRSNVTNFECDTGTSSSITLMMQALLPCLLFGHLTTTIDFKGGTNGTKSPSIEYFTNVLEPTLKKFGAKFTLDVKKKSYVPSGGALVTLTVTPVKSLKAYQLVARGEVEKIRIISFYTGTVHVEVPQRMVQDALKRMDEVITSERVNKNNVTCEIVKEAKVVGSAGGVILVTETTTGGIFSSFSLGGRGVNAEKVSKTATNITLRNLKKGGAVDEYLQDQILFYCAMAKGNSKIRTGPITPHTLSMIHLIRQWCPTTNIVIKKTKNDDRTLPQEKSYIIDIIGLAHTNAAKLG